MDKLIQPISISSARARWMLMTVSIAAMSAAAAGCDDNRRDTPGEQIEETVNEIGERTEEMGRDIEDAVDPPSTGERVRDTVDEAVTDVEDAVDRR